EKGLILLTCGIYSNVIRFLSPITIQDSVFTEALDIIETSIREISKAAK
ncbi:MAG: 4-aminobutyrate--2-oxoglutarate transaminase, partial [Hyphomicrobiales bacterium]